MSALSYGLVAACGLVPVAVAFAVRRLSPPQEYGQAVATEPVEGLGIRTHRNSHFNVGTLDERGIPLSPASGSPTAGGGLTALPNDLRARTLETSFVYEEHSEAQPSPEQKPLGSLATVGAMKQAWENQPSSEIVPGQVGREWGEAADEEDLYSDTDSETTSTADGPSRRAEEWVLVPHDTPVAPLQGQERAAIAGIVDTSDVVLESADVSARSADLYSDSSLISDDADVDVGTPAQGAAGSAFGGSNPFGSSNPFGDASPAKPVAAPRSAVSTRSSQNAGRHLSIGGGEEHDA